MIKNILILAILSFLLVSCDPKYPDPYVSPSLPPATFNFDVYPQDSVLHVGDTITFSAAISNKFGNTTLTDGGIYLGLYLYGSNHIPKTDSLDVFDCYNGIQYNMISDMGNPFYGSSTPGFMIADTTTLQNDSFKIKFSFVMLKKGLYQMIADTGPLTSSKGKTSVNGVFNVMNHHWSFFQVPGDDTPTVGTFDYNRIYFFAVQ